MLSMSRPAKFCWQVARLSLILLAACGGADSKAKAPPAAVESTTVAASGATAPGATQTGNSRTAAPRVLFLGTSLTAGLGLDDPTTEAYPAVIQHIADSAGVKAFVVNAGLSGETSARIRAVNPSAGILLLQMEAPTNLGPEYTRAFHAVFGKVASEEKVALAPFFLNGVAGIPKLNQPDGIHPTAVGARMAAQNLWPFLAKLLKR
jgi:acyl-CoA thioesterase-1